MKLMVGAGISALALLTAVPAIAAAQAPAGSMKVDVCGKAKYKPDVVTVHHCTGVSYASTKHWSSWSRSSATSSGSWVTRLSSGGTRSWPATFTLDKPSDGGFERLTVSFKKAHPSGLGQRATFTEPTIAGSSRAVTAPVPMPAPSSASPAPSAAAPACTTTSSGSCIRGGEFCPVADEGQSGYDAAGDRYVCEDSDNDGHPHWEVP